MAQKLKNALDKDVQQDLKELLQQATWEPRIYEGIPGMIESLIKVYEEKYNSCDDDERKKEYYRTVHGALVLYYNFAGKLEDIVLDFKELQKLCGEAGLC